MWLKPIILMLVIYAGVIWLVWDGLGEVEEESED